MKVISLSREGAIKSGVTIGEALSLICIYNKIDIEEEKKILIKKGFITADRDENFQPIGWRLTNKGGEILDSVILNSSQQFVSSERLTNLSNSLKEIFPKGRKNGTSYYWAEGAALITRRLELFFKKYGDKYTDNQILEAARKYVQSFNGNYQYMRLLKYFIFKEKVGANGEVEGDSELISYIENAGKEDDLRNEVCGELI